MGMKSLDIGIFRHGSSRYQQRIISLEEAHDLIEEEIPTISEKAEEFRHFLHSKVTIYSSLYGRALHTSKVIKEALDDFCYDEIQIFPEPLLNEVSNFDWKLFSPLVYGGTVNYQSEKIMVDAGKTNPRRLTAQEYFFRDCCHEFSPECVSALPKSYRNALESMERCSDVSKRMETFLYALESPIPVIAVTHEALVYNLLHRASDGKRHSLSPGHFLHVEKDTSGIYLHENEKGFLKVL